MFEYPPSQMIQKSKEMLDLMLGLTEDFTKSIENLVCNEGVNLDIRNQNFCRAYLTFFYNFPRTI